MKSFLITLGIQFVLWSIASIICALAGVAVTFGGAVWFLILVINVTLGVFINILIGNH